MFTNASLNFELEYHWFEKENTISLIIKMHPNSSLFTVVCKLDELIDVYRLTTKLCLTL